MVVPMMATPLQTLVVGAAPHDTAHMFLLLPSSFWIGSAGATGGQASVDVMPVSTAAVAGHFLIRQLRFFQANS